MPTRRGGELSPNDDHWPVHWGLAALPRRRLALTPERCSACGQDIIASQRYVRLMVGPTHVECRPGTPVDDEAAD